MYQDKKEIPSYAGDIDLKILNEIFSDIKISNKFSMDIGGSLIKLAYKKTRLYQHKVPVSQETSYDYIDSDVEHSCICFTKFETKHLTQCLNFLLENIMSDKFEYGQISVKVTGGGAIKYKDLINEKLNVKIDKVDEMEALVKGCVFLLKNIPDEVFYFEESTLTSVPHFSSSCLMTTYPFLLVNVGSGVSILKVEGEKEFQRVGGTSIGGGTFWGIGSLITGDDCFDVLLEMAGKGEYQNIDMLVKHIYGGDLEQYGLSGNIIASSFGRVSRCDDETYSKPDAINSLLVAITTNISQIACLHAQIYNLKRIIFGGYFTRGQILTMKLISSAVQFWSKGSIKAHFLRHEGYLGAVGAFLSSSPLSTPAADNSGARNATLSSKFVSRTDLIDDDRGWVNNANNDLLSRSWMENYAESNTFVTTTTTSQPTSIPLTARETPRETEPEDNKGETCVKVTDTPSTNQDPQTMNSHSTSNTKSCTVPKYPPPLLNSAASTTILSKSLQNLCCISNYKDTDVLVGFETRELDCFQDKLDVFRLLKNPETYLPDSWDLTADKEARIYWINCFKGYGNLQTVIDSQKNQSDTACERAHKYKSCYQKYMSHLETNPTLHGILTVRCILDAHQNFLRKFGFTDPFWIQKKKENELAMRGFSSRIKYLESLSWEDRQYEVVVGFLAGNVFDWGSKQVVQMMDQAIGGVIDFSVALEKLQKRPWLIDGYERWLKKMQSKPHDQPVYKCILIFCDNSGFDCIIGMIPFVIEMLSRGSSVILSANSDPAINDVTHSELVILMKALTLQSRVLDTAVKANKLVLVPNGQVSPCLDLRFISRNLNTVSHLHKVDLVLIEGMARSIHTNLYARFQCDSLKLAVIKNGWLANRLGGELFSVVFKYEQVDLL